MGTWKCKVCNKNIRYSNGYVKRDGLQAVRLISIRRHYKKKHPKKFREMIEKGVRIRRKKIWGLDYFL